VAFFWLTVDNDQFFHDSLHLNKNHTFQRPHSDHLHLSAILKYTVQQHIMYTVPHKRRMRNSIHNCHSPAFAATVHAFTYTTHNRWQIILSRSAFHKKVTFQPSAIHKKTAHHSISADKWNGLPSIPKKRIFEDDGTAAWVYTAGSKRTYMTIVIHNYK